MLTANPARRVGLYESKDSLAASKDGDLLIPGKDFGIESVIAKGRLMVCDKEIIVRGTFE